MAGSLGRMVVIVLVATMLIGTLSGCGRKNSPEHPPGSDFPRRYPAF